MKNVIMVNDIVPFADRIKEGSFRYVEQVSDEGTGIRYGGVISSLVEFQSYYSSGGYRDLTVGDTLYYYQEYDTDMDFNPISPKRRILIGIFTVEKCVREKFTYSVYAYDAIYKLNYDFSEYLSAFRDLFPMDFATFCSTIHNYCFIKFGITIDRLTLNCQNVSGLVNIDQFYAQGISLRDVISYIASFNLQYARCTPTGEIVYTSFSTTPRTGTTNWNLSDAYIIAPTDQVTYLDDDNQPLIPVFYKQNGLSAEDYHFANVDDYQVFIQDGSIVYRASADTLSDILNPYRITENFVANSIDKTGTYYNTFWNRIKTTGYADLTGLTSNYDITPFEVHLFPFRCPFNAGQIVPYIEDEKGIRYQSVVMKLELTDSEVVLSCSGPEYYYSDSSKNNTIGDTTLNLGVEIDGKVNKSGDTMTGNLEIDNTSPGEILKNTALDSSLPSYTPNNSIGFRLKDKNGRNVAIITDRYLADGTTGLWMTGWKYVNGSNINNNLSLYVDKNGNRVIDLYPIPWRDALGLGTSGALPITVGQGGTGATSTANAKANLGLGNAAQNLTFNPRTNANQIADFSFNDTNSASDHYNSQLRLIINDNGIFLYDATNVSTVWSLLTPIGVEYGGTGKTSLDTFFVDSKTVISSAPSSADLLMNYPSGAYRVAISGSQSVFPSGYGIMEVITAQDYGMIRFTRVNSTETKLYVRTYNTSSKTWYDTSWRAIGA